jgi:hypothetical protein
MNFNINISLIENKQKYSNKFKCVSNFNKYLITYSTKNLNVDLLILIEAIEKSFKKLLNDMLNHINPNDYMNISINNEQLALRIFLPFRQKKFITTDMIINEIIKITISKREFLFSGNIEIYITSIKCPESIIKESVL